MASLSSQGGHSAQVKMRLLVNGGSITVEQVRPDFLLVDSPFDHPPGDASVVLQVDQSERRWNVRLPHGISAGSKRVAIAARAQQLRVFYLLSENRIRQVSVHDLEITSAGIRTQCFRCHSQLHNSMPSLSHAAPFRLVSASLMTKRAFSRATSLARPAAFTESSTASKSL